MDATIYDDTPCALGEGPLWHPGRAQLFWFDIHGNRLMTRDGGTARHWQFDENLSAAGWIDDDTLLISSETGLWRFALESGAKTPVCALEADRPETRSNDGRADPWGGFWIGTMGKRGEPGAGAIYRYYRGELRRLHAPVTVSNAICFDATRRLAYFADSPTRRIMRQQLAEADGWPVAPAELFVDLTAEGLIPDGAVVDAEGRVWNAQWGASRVAVYDPEGRFVAAHAMPARHTSCPAFGGEGLATLFCTSAQQNLSPEILAAEPANGMTFALEGAGRGVAEPPVVLR